MKIKNKLISLALFGSIGFLGLNGCSRPTPFESTYVINTFNGNYSWDGKGPGTRLYNPIYQDQEKISHMNKMMTFPIASIPLDENGDQRKLSNEEQLNLESELSIVTAADKGISSMMIPEMVVTVKQKPDEVSVRKHYVEHRIEDQPYLNQNLDGIIRVFLQTKTKQYLEENQSRIGEECLNYVRNFKAGGIPKFDSKGKIIGFDSTYTILDEWGVDLPSTETRRIRVPRKVQGAYDIKMGNIKTAQKNYESAQAESERRLLKLQGMKMAIDKIGNNDQVYKYLTAQLISESIEDLGASNIGKLGVYYNSNVSNSQVQAIRALK
ncbi:MAG: hypothetical protein WC755_03020 [Candidatus Woesearchaeota archaeon]|jgi:hypothetical protein